jgi:heme oxygenase
MEQTTMNSTFLDRLLERTAEWNTRLGQNVLSINLSGTNATTDDYKKYLSALFSFVSGFEQYIYAELQPFIPDLDKRKKTGIIKDYLIKLGQDATELELMSESYLRSMYTDPYAALGALYVLESLPVGGELIQDHLQEKLTGLVGTLNCFAAHDENAANMWQIFLRDFSAAAEHTDKQENIIDGALRTFRLLDQTMTDESIKI